MLVVFPLGLLATAVVFDIVHVVTDRTGWAQAAFYMIGAGVASGAAAALFGWIDWFAIPAGTRAKGVGLRHGLGNVVVLVLFAGSWLLRTDTPTAPPQLAITLGVAGGALSMLTAWLGGELVDRLGVGVDDGAHLDAPSSLSGRPAREDASGGRH